jgi:hypothetical protein
MLADGFSTHIGIRTGYEGERNRIPRWFIEHFGLVRGQILHEVTFILIIAAAWLGILVFTGPGWADYFLVWLCPIVGIGRCAVGLYNTFVTIRDSRKRQRRRPPRPQKGGGDYRK